MSKMTKTQLISTMADAVKLSKKEVGVILTEIANIAYKEVKKNGEFVLPGFGKLIKIKRKAREGRNPATGETIKIPAKTVVKFRVAKVVKDTVL